MTVSCVSICPYVFKSASEPFDIKYLYALTDILLQLVSSQDEKCINDDESQ